jgi:hypothetical protein
MIYRSAVASIPALNGPSSTHAANKIRQLQQSKTQWPYPWEFPQENSNDAQPFGSIPCPAGGVLTEIMEYTVPTGMRFYLKGIVQQFVGAGFVQGSGNALWTLDQDTPIGASPLQGLSIPFYYEQPFTLGSFDNGPWLFSMPHIFEAGDTLRSKVITDGTIPAGAPNFFVTILTGWTVPAE